MSLASITSAQPSASDKKIVLRAGTYVDGISAAMATSRSRGMSNPGASDVRVVPPNHVARKLIVSSILDHELHLVVRREAIEVAPVVLAGLAAARTFHVDDLDDSGRHARHRTMAAGLEHDRAAARQQSIHQRV